MKYIAWTLVTFGLVSGCGKSAKELYREAIDDLNREAELLSRLEKERDDLKEKQADIRKKVDNQIASLEELLKTSHRMAISAKDKDWQKSLEKDEVEIDELIKGQAKMVLVHAEELGAIQKKVDDQAAVVREASKRRDEAKAAAE